MDDRGNVHAVLSLRAAHTVAEDIGGGLVGLGGGIIVSHPVLLHLDGMMTGMQWKHQVADAATKARRFDRVFMLRAIADFSSGRRRR